jgi:hypothetical protein
VIDPDAFDISGRQSIRGRPNRASTGFVACELHAVVRGSWDLAGEPAAVAWSRDSRQCAAVVTRHDEERFAFDDELVVLEP